MTTFADFAHAHGFQPYELAAYLDLGTDYDETAELTDTQIAEYTEIITHNEGDLPQDDVSVAARNVNAAEAAHAEAVTERNDAIRAAHTAGDSVTDIAKRAGLTRAMVYSIIDGKRRRS